MAQHSCRRPRSGILWRPADEAEAASNMAVFVEWLRATGRREQASPQDVRSWWAAEPEALLAAVGDFAEVPEAERDALPALAARLLVAEARPDGGAPRPG